MQERKQEQNRYSIILRTSVIGIIANIFLATFKVIIGFLSNSIAVILDGVNNLSDACSSVITIVGTKLAGKSPDKKHPFGYGRMEYLSAMIISCIVLYAGITSLVESVKKILHPEQADYSTLALIILAVAVVVKFVLGRYVKATGEKVNSDSLIASGEDALMDSIISISTLVAAGIYLLFHISLEAWLGAIIAAIIVKSGCELLRDTLSKILGEGASPELIVEVKKTIREMPGVEGAYDLILNNYGPDNYTGSVHIEVPDTFSADQIDYLTRQIEERVYREHHILVTAVGVYSMNTKEDYAKELREQIRQIVVNTDHVLQMHGFYLDAETKSIRFDAVISFSAGNRRGVYQEMLAKVQEAFPDYSFHVALDTDYSEL